MFLKETGLELATNALYQGLPNSAPRSTFSAVSRTVPAYLLTKDVKYKTLTDAIVNNQINLTSNYGIAWASGYLVHLGRYLDEIGPDPVVIAEMEQVANDIANNRIC